MILHKTQLQSFFSILTVFHQSHIAECNDSILTRSWLDKHEEYTVEERMSSYANAPLIPWFQQKLAALKRKLRVPVSTLFLELNNLVPTQRAILSQMTGKLLNRMVFYSWECGKKCVIDVVDVSIGFLRLIFLIRAWRKTSVVSILALLVVRNLCTLLQPQDYYNTMMPFWCHFRSRIQNYFFTFSR